MPTCQCIGSLFLGPNGKSLTFLERTYYQVTQVSNYTSSHTPLLCHLGLLVPNGDIKFSMGFPQLAWSLPLQSLQSVWPSCSRPPLGHMADVGSRMHDVWALRMLSKENNCLTPLELLERSEFHLILVLIANKEACSSPLEALDKFDFLYSWLSYPGFKFPISIVRCIVA